MSRRWALLDARERFRRVMHFEGADRLPFCEFLGYWGETVNRWYGEGLPRGMSVQDYFGFDNVRERVPVDFGPIPSFIPRVLSEDERYRVEVDEMGITKRALKTNTTIPSFIDFPVKGREDWEGMKRRFDPKDSRRYPKTWSPELFDYYETVDHPVSLHLNGFFGQARHFMGLQNLLVAFYRDPELVHDMMNFWADFLVEAAREAVEKVRIDYVTIWEDMAYRRGPHISPRLFREFMLPCYRKVTGFVRGHGIDTVMVDTDGNHEALTPLFLEGGVNCLYPLEVQAGMDAVALRERYGRRLLLIGNIDKRALAQGGTAIEREVESKLRPLREGGGYIPSVDHCVPADVSLQNYSRYISILKKHLKCD